MNELSITIFILILPGIISLLVIDNLVSQTKLNSFFFILYSMVIGLLTYCILQLAVWAIPFMKTHLCSACFDFPCLQVWGIVGLQKGAQINPQEVVWATIIAIPTGLIIAWLINYKLLLKIARKLKISTKYGDENLFSYYLNTDEIRWVYVRDKENDIVYQGCVLHYSENDKIQEIVLSDMTAFTYYDPKPIYSAPSAYICREIGKIQIEQIPNEKFT